MNTMPQILADALCIFAVTSVACTVIFGILMVEDERDDRA